MARRSSTTHKADEATPEVTEETAVSTTTETVETEAPKAEEKVIDLSGFQAAAETAAAEADTSTGEIAPAVVEPVLKEYRALDGAKAKNAAKAWLTEQMKVQMNAGSIQGARSFLQLQESMTAGGGG